MHLKNNTESILEHAILYASLGWRVIPLTGKVPVQRNWPQAGTTDETQIRAWFGPGGQFAANNIGIVCGPESGLLVIDVDPRHGGEESLAALIAEHGALAITIESLTGGGGRHILYRYPTWAQIGNSAGRMGAGLDVKATGGQVVAPPSIHPETGRPYVWELSSQPGETELADPPAWLIKLLLESKPQPKVEIITGQRNARLASHAGRLRAEGDSYESIVKKLLLKNDEFCKPPLAKIEVERIAQSISNYALPAREQPGGNKPAINAKNEDLPLVCDQAWSALLRCNEPPCMFCHGGLPVRIEKTTGGNMAIRSLTQDRLSHELARAVDWYKVRKMKDGTEYTLPAAPPRMVVVDMLAYPSQSIPLPYLERMASAPMFASDGTLLVADGYYPNGILIQTEPGLTVPNVPAQPNENDLIDAMQVIDELLVDFPFVSEADRVHGIALLLLPFARDLIDGPTPLHLIEAPQAGTGKGLLANLLLMPACGTEIGVMTYGRDEDETRKRLVAMLREGKSAVIIDNVSEVTSAALSSALTASMVSDRLLGATEMLNLPVRCVWVMTGNNPGMTTEIARRSIRIRLDAKVDRPWSRDPKRFKHARLYQWARGQRGQLIWAALTMIQNWLAAGRPAAKVKPLGSYESWSEVVGGILQHAGIGHFLANLDELYETADTDGAAWRAFVETWWDDYHDEKMGVTDLYRIALGVDNFDLGAGSERAQKTALGMGLARRRDMMISGYRIEQAGKIRNAIHWRLHQVKSS